MVDGSDFGISCTPKARLDEEAYEPGNVPGNSIAAFPADTANGRDPASIKAEISKRGTGEKARVCITTRDNKQLSGYIKDVGDATFVLGTKRSAETTALAYSDVSRVGGTGLRSASALEPLPLAWALWQASFCPGATVIASAGDARHVGANMIRATGE